MNYISTKQLAELWQVDTSRIVRLANEGRIPGAMLVGNSWMFPADTPRLPDRRRRENKPADRSFRFPLYFYTHHTPEALGRFSADERKLYQAERAFTCGDFPACIRLAEPAEQSPDPVVRLGALYVLCLSNLYLRRFAHATLCFRRLQELLSQDIPHRQVLSLLLHDLETYFVGNRFYLGELPLTIDPAYLPQLRDYYMLQLAFSDVMNAYIRGTPVNPLPYELFCLAEESNLTRYTSAVLHLYIALLYQAVGRHEKATEHLRCSCDIAEEHRLEHAIAFAFHYIPEAFRAALQDHAPDLLTRLTQLSAEATNCFNDLQISLGLQNVLHQLDAGDIKFVIYARQGLTNKEIGALLGLSSNTISKKYAVIFEKIGVHNKKDLVRLYIRAMEDYSAS